MGEKKKDVFDDQAGCTWRALGLQMQRLLPENKLAARCAGKGKSPTQHRLFEATLKPEISLLLPTQGSGSEKVLPLAESGVTQCPFPAG